MKKKKKVWSTKLAVLLVEQITSAREQNIEFWDSDLRFPKQMISVQVKNFMVLLMEKQSQVYTKRSKSSPKDSALQFPSDLPCANTHGLAVVSDHTRFCETRAWRIHSVLLRAQKLHSCQNKYIFLFHKSFELASLTTVIHNSSSRFA